jgi:uncharacterized protein (TIGR01244 family)
MTLNIGAIVAGILFVTNAVAGEVQQSDRARLERIQRFLSTDVPRVLCLDDRFATGGQPTGDAFSKAAASGFRSVVSLRTNSEGTDIARERASVESAKMRYFNIPVMSASPRADQADEFLRVARDKSNHPMLVTCASANRVGAFMMILRVIDQGWSEEKALEEAVKIGLTAENLRKFAKEFIAQHNSKRS